MTLLFWQPAKLHLYHRLGELRSNWERQARLLLATPDGETFVTSYAARGQLVWIPPSASSNLDGVAGDPSVLNDSTVRFGRTVRTVSGAKRLKLSDLDSETSDFIARRLPGMTCVIELATNIASGRATSVSELPAVPASIEAGTAPDLDDTQKVRLALYAEVSAAWRTLTDVRFKLLAVVPTVSGLALFALLNQGGPLEDLGAWAHASFALLGLVATLGLWLYDLRNSDLYDDLVSRGRRLEQELGVQAGVFRLRPNASWPIQHDFALLMVYGAALLGWLSALAILVGRAVL